MDLAARPSRIRWYILALLTGFSLVSYIERINLSVASRFIRDEFGLTDIQLGWTFSAFLVAYTAAQIPSGWLADRFGSRNILTIAALLWFAITVTMGVYVGWIASSAPQVLVSLIALRVMLGVAEAPTFPAGSSAIARWFPSRERGKASAIVQAASYGGEALTLVVLAAVVAASGWRTAIFLSAAPALVLAIAWWRFGRSRPEDHPGVNNDELALIRSDPGPAAARPTGRAIDAVLRRDVTLLSASYFCQGYVIYLFFFWFYIYLVDVRGFSIAAGGVVGALPTVAAAVCAFIGGTVSDRAAKRWGSLSGRRMVIVASALVGGALLLCGAVADHAAIAIACFVGAIGTRGLVESAYWSTIIDLSGPHAGTAGGAMNMMSNLGGAVSTALAPILVAQFGWATALSVAAFVTMLSGVMLLAMPDPRRPHRP